MPVAPRLTLSLAIGLIALALIRSTSASWLAGALGAALAVRALADLTEVDGRRRLAANAVAATFLVGGLALYLLRS